MGEAQPASGYWDMPLWELERMLGGMEYEPATTGEAAFVGDTNELKRDIDYYRGKKWEKRLLLIQPRYNLIYSFL